MVIDAQKNDQAILNNWMGTNGSSEYIKELVSKQQKKVKKPKSTEDAQKDKKNEWMRLARSFSGM